ncbi:HEPN domain-containing protein [Mycobacterium sp. NPDC050441]|uniref:HEPN domain-containing protein n=1 Tax=Mycobacterium sp. NPDC050441 TaxID=3155403 RepID=UPI0033CE3A63
MLVYYQELAADLTRIRNFLALPSSTPSTADERTFSYVACISTLYASFENFAERLAFRFSEILLSSPAYLSKEEVQKLRKRYVSNASSLLSQSLGSGRYQDVTELDVAQSLASCLDENVPYQLRLEILSLHNANLRWQVLGDMFRWAVDDLLAGVAASDAVAKWTNLNGATSKAIADELDAELKELVSRRNEIAHRGIPDEILSPESMLDKIDYIEVVALAMIASLATRVLELSAETGDSVSVGTVMDVFKQDRVAIVTLEHPVSEGETVWATHSKKVRWGRIKQIQLEDTRVPSADTGEVAGIELEFATAKGAVLHRWGNPTDDLVPAPSNIFGDKGPL